MKFMHLRLPNTSRGGITLAYMQPFPHARVVLVATAVCSRKDNFNKAVGRQIAGTNLQDGLAINIPVSKKMSVERQLHQMFSNLLEAQEVKELQDSLLPLVSKIQARRAVKKHGLPLPVPQ